MKKLTLVFLSFLFVSTIVAQPPQKVSYQAVVRDQDNNLIVNQQIGVKLSILETSPNGFPVFAETHTITTNSNGLMSLEIGMGTPAPQNDLLAIPWENGDYYLQSEIDLSGGQNYTIIGTQQLITVPYAFFAGTADYNQLINRPPDGSNSGDILYWDENSSSWQILPIGQQGQVLSVHNGSLIWIASNIVNNVPPTIVTDSVFSITGRTAEVRATIVDPGSTGIVASGVCWSRTPFPSIGNNHSSDGTSVGSFVSSVSGLTSGTIFYVRAYATNSVGTSYGQPISFTTPTHCGTVTDYDGNVYQSVYIGAQCWMKENLKTIHYSNGASIPKGGNGSSGKYYFDYLHSVDSSAIYGRLYTWQAVMNGAGSSNNNPSGIQGVCPSGWHVPSNTEWCELENYTEPGIDVNCSTTGFRGSMAKRLTAPQYWTSYHSNSFAPGYWTFDSTGCDDFGLSVLPSGYYYYSSPPYFQQIRKEGYFWTCTSSSSTYSIYRKFQNDQSGIAYETGHYRYYAYSVRCIKN